MMRTSTFFSMTSPTGRMVPSCSTRKRRTCSAGGVSPISSRNTVPPEATSNTPRLSAAAPVNAPFLCPNSSLSSSVSVMAPQLTGTNRRAARSELAERRDDHLRPIGGAGHAGELAGQKQQRPAFADGALGQRSARRAAYRAQLAGLGITQQDRHRAAPRHHPQRPPLERAQGF